MNSASRNSIGVCVAAFLVLCFNSVYGLAQDGSARRDPKPTQKVDCAYWLSLIDGTVERIAERIDELEADTATKGIVCLLSFHGNKNPARFSGALRNDISRTFPDTPAEVAALYYVSYLFHQRFENIPAYALPYSQPDFDYKE